MISIVNKTAFSIISKLHNLQRFNKTPDALMILDENSNLLMLDDKAQELFNYRDEEATKLNVQLMIPMWYQILAENRKKVRTEVVNKQGEVFTIELKLNMVIEDRQKFILVALQFDASNYKRSIASNGLRQERSSEIRPNPYLLRGLLNPARLEEILIRESKYSDKSTILLAVLINLDNFKLVNETYGQAVGDLVLKQIARIIADNTRPVDWTGRIEGDEFLVFIPCISIFTGATIAEKVRIAILETPIVVENHTLHTTVSMGVVSLPSDVGSIEEILRLTKASLNASKEGGKNCITVDDGAYGSIIHMSGSY